VSSTALTAGIPSSAASRRSRTFSWYQLVPGSTTTLASSPEMITQDES